MQALESALHELLLFVQSCGPGQSSAEFQALQANTVLRSLRDASEGAPANVRVAGGLTLQVLRVLLELETSLQANVLLQGFLMVYCTDLMRLQQVRRGRLVISGSVWEGQRQPCCLPQHTL
jgi:hypothetical protein